MLLFRETFRIIEEIFVIFLFFDTFWLAGYADDNFSCFSAEFWYFCIDNG